MIFKPYYYYETGCAASLFGCGGLGKCAVVDAHEEDVDAYIAFAASKDMRITHVLDTHVHADHRSGGPALAKKAGAAYCLHELANVALPFEPLHDGQEIELGNTRVKVLHTPESASFVVTDLCRGTDPNAGQLYDSIHAKLLTLADDLEVYPGHFSGSVCGAGTSGKPSSTIAFEKRWNPLLAKSRDEFVDALAAVPPMPEAMEPILRINQGREEVRS